MKAVPDDMHVLTGSYALDALTEAEREEFERHLQHCPSCAAEVRGLRETAARLALAKTIAPPVQMEQRVLAATYLTRQLPPAHPLDHPRDHPPDRHRLRSPRLIGAFAAAAVAVAVALGITQVSTQHQLNSAHQSAAAITKVLQAPDARLETTRTSAGGVITVAYSSDQGAAVITTTGMSALSAGRVYQAWVMSPSGARSAGLISHPGQISQLLASGVRSGDRIGITVEPAGGTSKPTTTPVVTVPLAV
ncbi:MAG: anti-sigma factor [Streptosporangiaceae bacterium]